MTDIDIDKDIETEIDIDIVIDTEKEHPVWCGHAHEKTACCYHQSKLFLVILNGVIANPTAFQSAPAHSITL